MADGIQADEEVHIKVEATNTQAQAIITVDTNIKFPREIIQQPTLGCFVQAWQDVVSFGICSLSASVSA